MFLFWAALTRLLRPSKKEPTYYDIPRQIYYSLSVSRYSPQASLQQEQLCFSPTGSIVGASQSRAPGVASRLASTQKHSGTTHDGLHLASYCTTFYIDSYTASFDPGPHCAVSRIDLCQRASRAYSYSPSTSSRYLRPNISYFVILPPKPLAFPCNNI